MKKIALTRLSGNITNGNKNNVGNTELFAIADILRKRFEVDILTFKVCADCLTIDENFDLNEYDDVFVLNDSCNMFGGAEVVTMTSMFKVLAKYEKSIYFILTDLTLPMIDYYKTISSKSWAAIYNKEDFKLKKPINILSQARNFESVRNLHKNIEINNIYYVPWHLWKLFYNTNNNQCKQFSLFDMPKTSEKTVDLIYGGNYRSGNRKKKWLDYFFDKDIKVEVYGNIKESNFEDCNYNKAPIFSGSIPNNEVLDKNNSSFATIVMGDKSYNNNMITLRFTEALMGDNVICFIDDDFDTSHELLGDDYFYVKSGSELQNKIKELKSNEDLHKEKLNIQDKVLNKFKNIDISSIIENILEEK